MVFDTQKLRSVMALIIITIVVISFAGLGSAVVTSSNVTLSDSTPAPGSDVTVTVTATPNNSTAGFSFTHEFNQSVGSASSLTTQVAGSTVDPIISSTKQDGVTLTLGSGDVTAGEQITIEYTITAEDMTGKSVSIAGDVTNGESRELPEKSYTITTSPVELNRTISPEEVGPSEQVTVTTEITGVNGSVSTSSSYDPQVAAATVQSVTVNGASTNPLISTAEVSGSVVTLSDVGMDATITITEELTVSEELNVTHQITGDVTAGETTTEVDPVSVTVTDADVDTPTPVLTVTDATAQPGTSQTTTAEIRATRLPTGIQEYELRVSLRNASVADLEGVTPGVVSGQAFQIQSRSTAGGRVTFRATDLAQTLEPGATNRTLATVTYTDTTTGTTPIELAVTTLTDDQGTSVRQAAVVTDGQLTVEPVTSPFPEDEELPGVGSGQAPTDPDDDGEFEDINGDGEKTFDDAIALAFANPSQLTEKQTEAVDFDADGDVDFGDAVALAFE